MTLLEQLIPKKFGIKERFLPDEVMEILGYDDIRTLEARDNELKPIKTAPRIKWYLRMHIETYLRKINQQ
jgi:hypothetical protein